MPATASFRMIDNKKIAVVLPAYNAEKTLRKTFDEIPHDIADFIILTDDKSNDKTIEVARQLQINHIIEHEINKGYGANQKSCYDKALSLGADIIIMLHPDYQYTPKLIKPMAFMIASGLYDVVLGSRILGKGAIEGGMPVYKYVSNRILTLIQNIFQNQKLSEYHTGYRAYSRKVLESISYNTNSNGYIFDNELLAQVLFSGFKTGEISCPTEYSRESSSIGFFRSVGYGFGVLWVSWVYFLSKTRICRSKLFIQKK